MHTLHAALRRQIADALEPVARIGNSRPVVDGDSMFGRIAILVPSNPAAKLAGEHRVQPAAHAR